MMTTAGINAQEVVKNQYGQLNFPNTYEIISTNPNATRAEDPYDQMEKIMACPEGSVYGSSWKNDGSYSIGAMTTDMSRSDLACVFYQSVDANLYKVDGMRFFGVFKYYDDFSGDWIYCNERGVIDIEGKMTEPVRFQISFHKRGADGLPSEQIYSKEFDVIGDNTGLMLGDNVSGHGYIYSFDIDLGEEVMLETGYVGITAVDMGDNPSCWFNLFTSASAQGTGLLAVHEGENVEWMQSFTGPACLCLKGSGEMSARKAVKLERFLAPGRTSDGKYEKVAVEISNAGSEQVEGVELELWNNGEFVSRETIDEVINPITEMEYDGKYKYVFKKTVDCSAEGENIVTVKNVYADDEKLCNEELSKKIRVYAENEAVESSPVTPSIFFINQVTVGNIDNATADDGYSDFTDMKTDIHMGENLEMTVKSDMDCCMYVWVDWNNNGNFGDAAELVGKVENNKVNIAIPQGLDIKPGDKRMRIVSTGSWLVPVYAGTYDYGETEDYTLTVKRNAGQPEFKADAEMLEITNTQTDAALNFVNNGEGMLDATLRVNYILPGSPDGMNIAHSAAEVPDAMKNIITARHMAATVPAPVKDAATNYVLGYDRGVNDCISMNGDEAIFAQMYPARMLENIKGMRISTVDVYVESVPQSASVIIYEGKKNSNLIGNVLAEKTFVPSAQSWNRIALDVPVDINGSQDIIVAVKMSGLEEGKYYIGTDAGDAVVGYGELAGFNGFWWSMADLGINSNYCIRANVTGEKTAAISWLDTDKDALNMAQGGNDALKVSYNGVALDNYLYNAVIEFVTNDELRKTVRIPVYMINDVKTGVISADLGDAAITYADNEIKVVSDKEIFNISVYDVNGQLVDNIEPEAGETVISTMNYDKGIYIVSVMYAGGNRQGVKIPVIK